MAFHSPLYPYDNNHCQNQDKCVDLVYQNVNLYHVYAHFRGDWAGEEITPQKIIQSVLFKVHLLQ